MNYLFIRKTIIVTALMGLLTFSAGAQNWLLLGNSGTSSSTNFIGTKDNQALVFITNNAECMRILGTGNAGVGTNSPLQKLDVNGNINIGSGFGLFVENHRVLKVDSVNANIFLGNGVGHNNTGGFNTATGYNAFFSNTSGGGNTAAGDNSLFSNTTGGYNTVNGYYSLHDNSIGFYNTACGSGALVTNTEGYSNTASGVNALQFNLTSSNNTATGYQSLEYNTGYGNTVNGDALGGNHGSYNTADGFKAMAADNSGQSNTAVGNDALYNNIYADYNCGFGYLAMSQAGVNAEPGGNNTDVGSLTGPIPDIGQVYNTIALGDAVRTTASNQARIGNSSTTSIGGYTNWTNISDGRVKKNIKQNVPGLAFINKLAPVTYNLDLDAADQIMQVPVRKDGDGKVIQSSLQEVNDRNAKQQLVYTGFIAQDAERAAKELNYEFSGVDAPKNDHDLYGLRYEEFVAPLVKAVQELSNVNDEKDATIDLLQKQIDDREKRIELLEATVNGQTRNK